jgi:hypothetical protein
VQWAKREHFDVRMLNEWHSKINERIINVLKRKKPVHRKLQVLKNRAHLEYLEQFHQRYVLVPADKASNNIIVACKKSYVDVIVNELQNIGQPSTYIASNYKYDQLLRKHLLDMQRWNIYVPPVMAQLPTMYWLPKLHKNP